MSIVVVRVATLLRPCQPLHSTLNLHITIHFMGFIKSRSNWALFGGVEECHTFFIYLFHSLPLNVLLKKSLCTKWRAEKAAVAAYPLSTLCNRHFFPPLTPPHHHTWLHTFLVNPLGMVKFWTIVSPRPLGPMMLQIDFGWSHIYYITLCHVPFSLFATLSLNEKKGVRKMNSWEGGNGGVSPVQLSATGSFSLHWPRRNITPDYTLFVYTTRLSQILSNFLPNNTVYDAPERFMNKVALCYANWSETDKKLKLPISQFNKKRELKNWYLNDHAFLTPNLDQ